MSVNCAYCEINPSGNSDHVFPKSLGGEDIYMDCVCDRCNNEFSKFERELFQKSIIGLMRSAEGVEGYSKNKTRPAPLKFPEIFQYDKKEKIVYEVGVHNGFKPYMRPQIILHEGKFYSEAPTQEELNSFLKLFHKWKTENLIIITKFPSVKGERYEAVKFVLKDEQYVIENIELEKVKKEIIHYSLMKDKDEYRDHFEPRIFIDDSNNLIVRSREVAEGVKFLIELLNYCNQDGASFSSYPIKNNTKDFIRISMKFDLVMMQQALVKIGLNALMHYHPETKYNQLLKPAKDHALKGTPIKTAIDKKIELLDTREDLHSVLFYQLNEGLMIRSSLFGGHFTFSFLIEHLNLFDRSGKLSALEVDFNKAKQKHLSMQEFLLNKANDLGRLNNMGI